MILIKKNVRQEIKIYKDRVSKCFFHLYKCPRCSRLVERKAQYVGRTCIHCVSSPSKESLRQVAMAFNVSLNYLYYWLKKEGLDKDNFYQELILS